MWKSNAAMTPLVRLNNTTQAINTHTGVVGYLGAKAILRVSTTQHGVQCGCCPCCQPTYTEMVIAFLLIRVIQAAYRAFGVDHPGSKHPNAHTEKWLAEKTETVEEQEE